MLQVPHDIGDRFEAAMQSASIASDLRPHFRRWLRFYLDFCAKYGFDPANGSSFRQFNTKLQDKGQVEWKRRQAHEAIVLYIRSGVGGATGGNLQGKKDAQEVATFRSATNVSKNASEGMLCSIPFVQAWGKRRMSGRGAAIAPQSINVRGRLENALSASNIKSSWTAMNRLKQRAVKLRPSMTIRLTLSKRPGAPTRSEYSRSSEWFSSRSMAWRSGQRSMEASVKRA